MDYLAITIITLTSGVVGTGLGGLLGGAFKRDSDKIISILLAFAAGVMLSIVCFDLMSAPISKMRQGLLPSFTPIIVAIAVIIGYCLVYFLNRFIDGRAALSKKASSKSSLFVAGITLIVAIAVHNLPEGMVIGASYANQPNMLANLFKSSGFIMAIVIGMHNIPEGMAICVPLLTGGMKKTKAVLLTALSGLPTVFGALLGYSLGGINDVALILSLGFASGAMLYVALGELIPQAITLWKSKLTSFSLFTGLLVGFLLVMV
ncbi:MAG: ZIP family metal transporter [Clostridia bacterium]|nr:ZIP family metal transporter [Clostridia bacterium]MDE7329200.1 ZIP family metal transporter [Clostridia bacterium]